MLRKIIFGSFISIIVLQGANLKDKAPSEPATKLEKIQRLKGSIINKGYTEVGSMYGNYGGKIIVIAYEFHNLKNRKKDFGLSVEIVREKSYGESRASSFIDMDEISHLINGIQYLEKIKKNPTKSKYFESKYQTKGGLSITLFNDSKGNMSIAISVGKYSTESAYLDVNNLTTFKELIIKGEQQIKKIQ